MKKEKTMYYFERGIGEVTKELLEMPYNMEFKEKFYDKYLDHTTRLIGTNLDDNYFVLLHIVDLNRNYDKCANTFTAKLLETCGIEDYKVKDVILLDLIENLLTKLEIYHMGRMNIIEYNIEKNRIVDFIREYELLEEKDIEFILGYTQYRMEKEEIIKLVIDKYIRKNENEIK